MERIFFLFSSKLEFTADGAFYVPHCVQYNGARFRNFAVNLSLAFLVVLFVLLARNFELKETSIESFLAAHDCCLAHLTPSNNSSGPCLDFASGGYL